MANKTDARALALHARDPQSLLPSTLRHRIYASAFWNTKCFAISTADLVHHATQLTHLPSATAATDQTPSPFLCLLLKLLQQSPDDDVIDVFLNQTQFKYPRVLAALYLRLSFLPGAAPRVYRALEPLLSDYRKLCIQASDAFHITYVDDFIDRLLCDNQLLGISLPRLPPRYLLTQLGLLQPRISALPKHHLDAIDVASIDNDT